MSDTPVAEQAAERESLKTRNWVLGAALGLLFLFFNSLLTYNFTNGLSKLDTTNVNLAKVLTSQEVQQVINTQVQAAIRDLQDSRKEAGATHKEFDNRLGSLEQRQATTDAYISAHKYDK